MKSLHVVPNVEWSSATRELDLLSADGSVAIETFDRQHWLDPRPLWMLAGRIKAFQPDILQVWGLTALRAVRLALPKNRPTIVVRKPISSERPRGRLSLLDRWLLLGTDCILAASLAEAGRCAAAGIPSRKLRVVPPGVRTVPSATESAKPTIICAGGLVLHKGFYEAIWAFDMLRFAHDEVELVIAGDGPERRRLEQFIARTKLVERIHLLGDVADIAPHLAKAWMVWVPSLTDSGAGIALQAMAAGRPVVASRWPGLGEIVLDGQTGFLVDPGSKIDLARQTKLLLDDAVLRQSLGSAGRRRAENTFSSQAFAEQWQKACTEAAA